MQCSTLRLSGIKKVVDCQEFARVRHEDQNQSSLAHRNLGQQQEDGARSDKEARDRAEMVGVTVALESEGERAKLRRRQELNK